MTKNKEEFVTHQVKGNPIHLTLNEDWKFGKEGYKRLKNSARTRNIPFEIPEISDLIEFWLSQPDECYWCQLSIQQFHDFHKRITKLGYENYLINKLKKLLANYNSRYLTYDRIDSSKGYHVENMVKSCPICNFTKGSFLTKEEFKPIARNNINRLMAAIQNEEERTAGNV